MQNTSTIEFTESPPILVVVVSESTKTTDYRAKRSEYGILDIAEYWIIDPLLMKLTVFRLDDGWYEPAEFQGDALIQSSTFPALQLSLDRIIG